MSRAGRATVAVAVLCALTGCGPRTGTVDGYLGYAGGPRPATPAAGIPALSGTVIIRKAGIEVARLRTEGTFAIRLTPGDYTFTEAELGCPARTTVRAARTTRVLILCSIK